MINNTNAFMINYHCSCPEMFLISNLLLGHWQNIVQHSFREVNIVLQHKLLCGHCYENIQCQIWLRSATPPYKRLVHKV